jgi:hypothetical protein
MRLDDYPYIYPVCFKTISDPNNLLPIDSSKVSLTINRSGGLPYGSDYQAFEDEVGNIFLGISLLVKGYSLTLDIEGIEYSINNVLWESISELIDIPVDSASGIFMFTGSKPVVSAGSGRCDVSMSGPSVFVREGEAILSDVFNSTTLKGMSDLESFQPLISAHNVGHIVFARIKKSGVEEFDTNQNSLPHASRTLSELMRLMVEWRLVTNSPWNSNEELPVAVNQFLEIIGISSEVENKILETQCDMQVARFLKGNSNARQRPPVEEIQPITSFVKAWLATKFLHSDIESFYQLLV